ncbi:hypothetical protein A4A49_57320 [Nicotiana attenuata]|uniref:Uncharacterized protein n=1 Tax=Nicotiana attenuata TaxID=49451 RepID=A0A1J6KBU6_NICAT|nr:hypothetical protein A4A49_57320 [Nicotiana attenuata]
MGCWYAENANKAFLKTMNMGKRATEPNGAEFISALAAGNNVQLMVVAYANVADSTTLALVAAAQQTGGRVVGEGLLLTRIGAKAKKVTAQGMENRGHWIVKVDKCIGEEHVYRVKSPRRRVVEA